VSGTSKILRECLEDRFFRLGDVLVQRIEAQRSIGSLPRTLGAIADAVASEFSILDDSAAETRERRLAPASRIHPGARQAARAIAGVKSRLADPNQSDSSPRGASPGPNKRSIEKGVIGAWSTGTSRAELELDIKQAIAVALQDG
jgi:hypothetical protein